MKLNADCYRVNVTARFPFEEKANKETTGFFLNYAALVASVAAEKWEEDGCTALADGARRFSADITEALHAIGFYD